MDSTHGAPDTAHSSLIAHHSSPSTQHAALSTLTAQAGALHLFRGVVDDDIGRAFLDLLRGMAAEHGEVDRETILRDYARLFGLLAARVELGSAPLVGDAWQDYLLDRLLCDENPFSVKAERVPPAAMGPSLLEAARNDLNLLRQLFLLNGEAVFALLRDRLGDGAAGLASWSDLRPLRSASNAAGIEMPSMKVRLASEPDWPSAVDELAHHYAASGSGEFARFRAFRWVHRNGIGQLEGVACPDEIRLEELVEYDLERALLLQNTEQFVEGFPANNVLLYGDRGTGKSSTIKALLHRFGDRGLRLVEVPKSLLGEFPRILSSLRGRRQRFILFVDDLSFDERETAYKELKAALEGSVEARPDNVVVYATSNRRHLVQERFSDRAGGDGEIRGWDTHQEKLSLADRFGVTLVFMVPDQSRYLRIVRSLVDQRGLETGDEVLRARALEWAAQQGGFSGRSARQFVDHLTGELALRSRKAEVVGGRVPAR